MSAVEVFLASQQRYVCERLAANLTVAQCDQNRKRVTDVKRDIYKVTACEGCAGLGKAVELEERMDKCAGGARAVIKGQCRPCYDKAKHKERVAKKAAAAVVVETPAETPVAVKTYPPAVLKMIEKEGKPIHRLLKPPPALSMTLDFSGDADLFAKLIECEIDADQVIGLLAMLVDNELAVAQ